MLEAIFVMKSYTIHRRTRCRDIIDLRHFVQQGKMLADFIRLARLASPSVSDEHAKAVLCDCLALDAHDQGFALLAPNLTLEQIYTYFAKAVDAVETERAKQVAQQMVKEKRPE